MTAAEPTRSCQFGPVGIAAARKREQLFVVRLGPSRVAQHLRRLGGASQTVEPVGLPDERGLERGEGVPGLSALEQHRAVGAREPGPAVPE